MRRTTPLILGAGPAGCAAAITLARAGLEPVLLDRDRTAGDALCGGFLSWRTAAQVRSLGVDPAALGARTVERVALFAGTQTLAMPLPAPAFGLSRGALDNALRQSALESGARLEVDTARTIEATTVVGQRQRWSADGLMLATGKHDVRGFARPRQARDPALGLRVRLPASAARTRLLAGSIELHLFEGGYAGIVLQEDGCANLCLAVRKSRLAASGGDPHALLGRLGGRFPALAERLGDDWRQACIDTIGAVPYGWIARETEPGLFRLGDQAAVIPSLAGEGIAIALASGILAARVWLEQGSRGAPAYQREMARRAARPVRLASVARMLAESPAGAAAGLALAAGLPSLLPWLMRASRIEPDAPLAHPLTAP